MDSTGNAYARGGTCSTNFPVTQSAYQTTKRGACDAFLTKISPGGNQFLYSTYIGGSGNEYGELAGASAGPVCENLNCIDPPLIYSSMFGGSAYGAGVALDAGGYVYVSGTTNSQDFPVTPGAYQSTNLGSADTFLMKLDLSKTAGAAAVYSTLIGGSSDDRGRAVVVDGNGIAYVHGETRSMNFPVTADAAQGTYGGGWDLFLAVFDPEGKNLLYSSYFGASGDEQGLYGLARDATGGIYMGAACRSGSPIPGSPAEKAVAGAGWDGYIIKLNMGPLISPGWVQNSASTVAGRVAPGLIAVVYGEFFGPAQIATMVVENNQVKNIAGETKVYFDGVAAPIVYALNFGSYSGVSCIVPWEVAGKATTRVQVEYRNVKGNFITVPVAPALPAFYTINQSGTGPGAFQNHPDYSINGSANPVERGGWVFMYGTGGGVTSPAGVTGSFSHYPPLYSLAGSVTVTIGGKTLPASDVVAFAAPELVSGAIQVNAKIPTDIPAGPAEVILRIGNEQSRAGVTVHVK